MPRQGALLDKVIDGKLRDMAAAGDVKAHPDVLMFDRQLAVIRDESKAKIAFCGRRSGKTTGWCFYLTEAMRDNPREICLFVGQTKDSAKDIIWREYSNLNAKHGWGLEFGSDLRIKHPNGASVTVMGCNTTRELEKARGPGKIRLAIVDECQSHKPANLQYLVQSVLQPGLMDVGGTLCLSGTPGKAPIGYWYDVTSGKVRGWSVHTWTSYDNPHVKAREFIDQLCLEHGWDMSSPIIRREYLCEWVKDEDALVFAFDRERNVVDYLPAHDDQWRFVLAMDYGVVHSTAWCVWGWGPYGKEAYIMRSFKRSGMSPSRVADVTMGLIEEWDPELIVGDLGGLGKAYAQEMEERHGVTIQPADKRRKRALLEFMSDDMRRGVIKSHKDNETLHQEFDSLVWDELHEDIAEGQDDHESEAAAYGYQYTPAYQNNLLPRQREMDDLPKWVKRPDEPMDEFIRRRRGSRKRWNDVGYIP